MCFIAVVCNLNRIEKLTARINSYGWDANCGNKSNSLAVRSLKLPLTVTFRFQHR